MVAAKDPVSRQVRYWQIYAALFGYESAVYGFGRWSDFFEAAGRRICMLLWSMYVDDGTLIEPSEAATEAQTLINDMFNTLGFPLADKKRILVANEGDFLGVVHNLKQVAVSGVTSCLHNFDDIKDEELTKRDQRK